MGFDDTLQVFLQRNKPLTTVDTPLHRKAAELGIDASSLDMKDVSYALQQYEIEMQMF